MAFPRSLLLPIGFLIFLLSVDAAVSLGLVASMVAFLHGHGQGPFAIAPPGESPFPLPGEPASLVTNPGHLTNGAGGTALVVVGFGGIIALWRERWTRKKWDRSSRLFYAWSVLILLSFILTLSALIYTFAETAATSSQTINLGLARANPPPAQYPDGRWTPETWYAAVLSLPLASADQARVISRNLDIMRAWRWNLVALFLLGFVLLVLVAVEVGRARRRNKQALSMAEVLGHPAKPRV